MYERAYERKREAMREVAREHRCWGMAGFTCLHVFICTHYFSLIFHLCLFLLVMFHTCMWPDLRTHLCHLCHSRL